MTRIFLQSKRVQKKYFIKRGFVIYDKSEIYQHYIYPFSIRLREPTASNLELKRFPVLFRWTKGASKIPTQR